MASKFKKPATVASTEFWSMFDKISKAALIDALWCACQLGTDESKEQIQTQAARNVVVALDMRGDRCPVEIKKQSELLIDSD